MSRRLLVVLFAIVAIAGLAACGDDDGGIDEETTTTAEETTTTADDEGSDDSVPEDDDDEQSSGDLPDGQSPSSITGEDEGFDALSESCFDGDMAACDYLYVGTPVDSDYEAYGDTCGGREDADSTASCSSDYSGDWETPDGQSPESITGEDADFDDLAEECFDGDFPACDDLYSDTPADSDYEAYGATCGGRLPSDALEQLVAVAQNAGPGCDETYGQN